MQIPYRLDFTRAESAKDLAAYLGVSSELLHEVVQSSARVEFYYRHQIPKRSVRRSDRFRTVWQAAQLPYLELTDAHKAFARRFELFARIADPRFPHEAAYGYVRSRGTRDNAAVHCGAPLLLRADLKNFFPSISTERLVDRFIQLGMKTAAARALGKFATIEDSLPLGLNASPMLANLVCVDMDIKVQELATRYGCRYTRYADDIFISGNRLPDKAELEKIVTSMGFSLSPDKFRITKPGQAHYVTGLSIADANGPHAPRHMKRKLRQELYYCKKFGIEDHLAQIGYEEGTYRSGVNRLDGTVRYVSHVEGAYASSCLRPLWKNLLSRDGLEPRHPSIESRSLRQIFCFIDESEIIFENKRSLALGLFLTEDPAAISASTIAVLRKFQIEDPFYPGDREALERSGLHFVDAHPDLRTAYLETLARLSFRAFVVYAELKDGESYEDKYVSLLALALRNRFIRYDRTSWRIAVEENSKVNLASLSATVRGVYRQLEDVGSRRPLVEPEVFVGKKRDEPSFAVPDFILAVFGRFAQLNEKPNEPNRRHQFERLRDKYRSIVDADSNTEYSRRRSFEPWPLSVS